MGRHKLNNNFNKYVKFKTSDYDYSNTYAKNIRIMWHTMYEVLKNMKMAIFPAFWLAFGNETSPSVAQHTRQPIENKKVNLDQKWRYKVLKE